MAKVEVKFTITDELDENGEYTCQIHSEEEKDLECNKEFDENDACVPELLSFVLRELVHRDDLLYHVAETIITDVKNQVAAEKEESEDDVSGQEEE